MEMVISYHFLCEDLVHHPIETSNKKWLALGFQVDVVLPLSIITSVCVCEIFQVKHLLVEYFQNFSDHPSATHLPNHKAVRVSSKALFE